MFRSTRLNGAENGGGGNRTRVVCRWVRLNEAALLRNLIFASLYLALVAVAVAGVGDAPEAARSPETASRSGGVSNVRHGSYEHRPSLVICDVFGDRYCGPALRVSWCESRFDTRATNGQYRGLFQMGAWERRRFGHGSSARAQALAARRYFVATGRTWRPWSCKP